VLLGDFNFVERRKDKSSLCGKLIPNNERLIFLQLKLELGIEDQFPPHQSDSVFLGQPKERRGPHPSQTG
jgi:hypothetical protein